jgi:hypothetical protein
MRSIVAIKTLPDGRPVGTRTALPTAVAALFVKIGLATYADADEMTPAPPRRRYTRRDLNAEA